MRIRKRSSALDRVARLVIVSAGSRDVDMYRRSGVLTCRSVMHMSITFTKDNDDDDGHGDLSKLCTVFNPISLPLKEAGNVDLKRIHRFN